MFKLDQLRVPLIQGGMGIGVSLGNLAGHVMLEGGLGVISAAQPGYREADFYQNTIEANLRALEKESPRLVQSVKAMDSWVSMSWLRLKIMIVMSKPSVKWISM